MGLTMKYIAFPFILFFALAGALLGLLVVVVAEVFSIPYIVFRILKEVYD
jgi:hypothetical protein